MTHSERFIKVHGKINTGAAPTDELIEGFKYGFETVGIQRISTVEVEDGEITLNIHWEGEPSLSMNATNFGFGEKIAYLAEQAKEVLNLSFNGEVTLHEPEWDRFQRITVEDGIATLHKSDTILGESSTVVIPSTRATRGVV